MSFAREGTGVRASSLRAGIAGALIALAATIASAAPAAPADSASPPSASVEAAPVAPRGAPWPPPLLTELPERDPVRAAIDRAWRLPAASLAERVARTQRAGLAFGLRELDGPARALLLAEEHGDLLTRAEHAVELAPGLPAAHASLARARRAAGDFPGASRALGAAIDAIAGHLEARAWAQRTLSEAAIGAACAWAAVFALLGAIASLPNLTYGLGATRAKLTGPAALAGIASLVLLLAWVEGPAGAVLGLAGVAMASGGMVKRVGVLISLGAALLALNGGFESAATGRLLLVADPVATAVQRIEAGLSTPADIGIALRAAPSDLDAARAIALHAKRSGDREAAVQYFARVLAERPDAGVYNNAANVAYALDDLPTAIALYEKSTQQSASAIAYFNLSQAYGRAIRLDDQDQALAKAQSIDALTVERLTGRVAEQAYVADASFSVEAVAARVAATGAPRRLAAALRERWAPGWLGKSLVAGIGVALIVLAAATAGGSTLVRAAGPRDFYADLARTLRAGVGDSSQRVAQLTKLRRQRARTDRVLTLLAICMPGAAGFRFGRPLLALVASLAFACGAATAAALAFAPPDPLAVGALPALLAQLVGIACVVVYGIATALAFALRVEE